MKTPSKFWAIVPAGGIGKRMQSDIPKQYLPLAESTVLEVTLQKLSRIPQVQGIIVAVAEDDPYYSELKHIPPNTVRVSAGKERADSVLSGLEYLRKKSCDNDWALVHDAVRPCFRSENVVTLINLVSEKQQGGLLAAPVADTLKSVKDGCVQKTVDRSHLWLGHTPQVFPVGDLYDAISQGLKQGVNITDEASAIESFGGSPLVVVDSRDNIKITQPEDLALAEYILKAML